MFYHLMINLHVRFHSQVRIFIWIKMVYLITWIAATSVALVMVSHSWLYHKV